MKSPSPSRKRNLTILPLMNKTYSWYRIGVNWMIEFAPPVIFFISYQYTDFISAVLINLAATVVSVFVAQLIQRRFALFPVLMLIFLGFFGGLTWYFDDPRIYYLQHTLYYGGFGLIILGAWLRGFGVFKPLFSELFALTEQGWLTLSFRWGIFFLLLGTANEMIWRMSSEAEWVTFKLLISIMLVIFGSYQLTLSRRERLPEASPWGLRVH